MNQLIVREITELKTNEALRVAKGVTDAAMRSTKLYELDNGQQKVTSQKGQHYKKEDGTFADTDPTIITQAQLDLETGKSFTHCCEKASIRAWFNDYDKPIKLKTEDGEIIVIEPKTSNKSVGVVDKEKITYSGAYKNTDIIRQMTPEGLKNWAELSAPGHPTEFEFIVTNGLDELKKHYSPGYVITGIPGDERDCTVEWTPTGYIWRLPDLTSLSYPILVDDNITFDEGDDSQDNAMRSRGADADENRGLVDRINVGDYTSAGSSAERGLIKWDISVIDSGATVTDTTLSLFESAAAKTGGDESAAVEFRRLLVDWDEGDNTPNQDSNWNDRTTGVTWNTAGAAGSGIDISATLSATVTLDKTAAVAFVPWTSAQLITDVGDMVSNPATNYGWRFTALTIEDLAGALNFNEFRSSQHATVADRPKLEVTFTPAPGGVVTERGPFRGINRGIQRGAA